MKNRKLLLIVSLVLAMTMSLGGTLAYLTDQDADVNTMTLGKVTIEQHEYERAIDADGDYETYTETEREDKPTGYRLQAYTQNKPLLPVVGDPNGGWQEQPLVYFAQLDDESTKGTQKVLNSETKNIQDKFVFVKNTGSSDAYVRTYVAFEIGSKDASVVGDLVNFVRNDFWTYKNLGKVTINGNNYCVAEFLYEANASNGKHPDGIVHPGDFTYCNLAQVYLASEATNEDVEALDGNKNGTYDILVLSQAVQADGFAATAEKSAAQVALDTGFGAATAAVEEGSTKKNVEKWLEDISGDLPKVHQVNDAAGLKAAMAEGGVIYLNGTANLDGTRNTLLTANATTPVKVIGGTIAGDSFTGELYPQVQLQNGNVTFENVTFNVDEKTGNWAMSANISGTANVTFRNCTFIGVQCPIYQSGANTVVTIENCTFDTDGCAIQAEVYSGDYQLGQDLIIKNCDFGDTADVLHILDHDKDPSSEAIAEYLKMNGNTFTGTCKQTCN